ncbi:MAG: GDP-mannose 4,6-dehydratase [Pseudobdellovibrionaceae bacterium]
MKKIVITGGAGFIGSHIVDECVESYPDAHVTVLDKMTYAADIRNVRHHIERRNFDLIVGDICDIATCSRALDGADLLIHAAAESHVDNSFGNSLEFSKTNVVGTHCLMEVCRQFKTPKIIHVSTDEVYGEVMEGSAHEDTLLRPTNPYSASKAAAEMVIQGYLRSFKLPVTMIRANNMFGIRQYPEKILPKFLYLMMNGEKLTLHGSGENKRHFLNVRDFTKALKILIEKGEVGECYNIGTTQEYRNVEVAHMICALFGVDPADQIIHVEDRPFNDGRYAVNWDKITQLGWDSTIDLADHLPTMAAWYVENYGRYHDPERKPVRLPQLDEALKKRA